MNEEIDDSEFYHHDFTTASEWEVFIARLEEIIVEWRNEDLKNETLDNPATDVWQIRTETVSFVDFDFTVSYHRTQKVFGQKEDEGLELEEQQTKRHPFDTGYDFELYDARNVAPHSCLAYWYGINQYIVISPSGNSGVTNESRIKVLLSSAYVATGNTKCEVPIFVQIRHKWQQNYLGVFEHNGARTHLEMVHVNSEPPGCRYLSGLLQLFRSKLETKVDPDHNILISVRQSYILTDFGNLIWKQPYINPDNETLDSSYLITLPFGVTADPVVSIVLKSSHFDSTHKRYLDNQVNTEFKPIYADKWTALITTSDSNNLPICLLGDCLSEIRGGLENVLTMYEVLGDFITVPQPDVNNPLDLLTEPKVPTISTLLSRAARSSISKTKKGSAPLAEDVLVTILYYLFPDAEDHSPNLYEKITGQPAQFVESESGGFNLEYECRGLKTCKNDSLVWRLAIVLSHCQQSLGGHRALSYLWYEFVQEMRYRWDKSISIPGLQPGCPDLRTCLLHQKLQMLNCCIERKQKREKSSFDSAEGSSSTDEEDEEFFDCTEKPSDEEQKRRQKYSLWNQPVGRLGKFNNLKLITTGDPLYIPVTQEPVPKSEDQLEEDTDVLLKLGSDAQGSELRAKMMSASLLSDMESFKAANPGSILEDFIRWYSPRDWIEDEDETDLDEWGQKKGHLSSRMLIEDNFWVQTWKSAKPVAAHRQKRLFDDTREAEKVLHFLDSRTVGQICELVGPVLCHAAIYKVADELAQVPVEASTAYERLRTIIKSVERLSRENRLQSKRFQNIVYEMSLLELKISEINSLWYKLNPTGTEDRELSDIVSQLTSEREVEIVGKDESNLGGRLVNMFLEAQRAPVVISNDLDPDDVRIARSNAAFPYYNEREVVMRVSIPKPKEYSTNCPQFMRSIWNCDEFRLCGAFTDDLVFF